MEAGLLRPADMITGTIKKNADIQVLTEFFMVGKTKEELTQIQQKISQELGLEPLSQQNLSWTSSAWNYLFGGEDRNTKIVSNLLKQTNNVMHTYIVATTVPEIYYNEPLAILTKLQTGEQEFNMYYEMLMLHCALDQIRIEYETLLENIARFEHRDALKRIKEGGNGLVLDQKWLNSLKIRTMYNMLEFLGQQGVKGGGTTLQETEWVQTKKVFMSVLMTAGLITSAAAAVYAPVSIWSFFTVAAPAESATLLGGMIQITPIVSLFTKLATVALVTSEGTRTAYQMSNALNASSTLIETYSQASEEFKNKTKDRKQRVYMRVLKLVTKMQILSTILQKSE